MRKFFKIFIPIILLLSGCNTAPSSTPELEPLPQLSPTSTFPIPTVTSLPTPTQIPTIVPTATPENDIFHFYKDNPVLRRSDDPDWDNVFIDPGAMIHTDGMFHMFFNGINGFPAPVGVGYATSSDGYHWKREVNEPVLKATQLEGSNILGSNLFVTSVVIEDNGTWALYFYTLSGSNFNGQGEIGRATAPTPTGPWVIDSDPVLSPGAEGSWDDVQVTSPNVLHVNNGYIMYYDGHASSTTSMIGMASSTDGIHWTKHDDPSTTEPEFAESDPVLTTSADGWDSVRVIDPNVVRTSDGWTMVYLVTTGGGKFSAGTYSFGVATSTDGTHWEKSRQNPVLSNKNHNFWSASYLVTMLHVEDTFYLYFDFASTKTKGTVVDLATYQGSLK